ncbi:trace amine-associated receptor 3-like [Ambystoma mexicanum]|uniref:trace amine-associated receptor 3-like n=1 Tax=Ambystoma mexicanum TaxID=8296 RepID=UPI0037E8F2DD
MDIPEIPKDLLNCVEFGNGSCPSTSRTLGIKLTMYFFMAISIVITIFGNLGLIISIAHFKQLQSQTNCILLSLATTDFLLGITIMPYSMIRSVESCWYFGQTFCKFHASLDLMLSVASIFHLCSIAIDRYCAICDPLHYSSTMTKSVVRELLVFCWSVPAVFAFGLVLSEENASGIEGYETLVSCFNFCALMFNKVWGTVVFTVCFFTPGSIMVGIYVNIFSVSKRHARVIENPPENMKHDSKSQFSKKKERKAAKTLGIIMGVFLTCWLPAFLTVLIDPYLGFSTPIVLFDMLIWLGYFNSTCNPLIHGFFYKWFRKALWHIVSGKICDPCSSSINLFLDM